MPLTHDINMMLIYIDSLDHVLVDTDKFSYSAKQVYSYSIDEAINHIISHHVIDSRMSQFNDMDIRRIYEEVYKKINVREAVPDTYFDKHIFYYKDIGISVPEGYEETESINQLQVITLPGTKDILTMYPRKGTDAYLDEKELPDYFKLVKPVKPVK